MSQRNSPCEGADRERKCYEQKTHFFLEVKDRIGFLRT